MLLLCAGQVLSSCASVNVRQIAYETLRQEDCHRNELEVFCTRTFASEYWEYERMRQDFLRSQSQPVWRVARDETTLQDPLPRQ